MMSHQCCRLNLAKVGCELIAVHSSAKKCGVEGATEKSAVDYIDAVAKLINARIGGAEVQLSVVRLITVHNFTSAYHDYRAPPRNSALNLGN